MHYDRTRGPHDQVKPTELNEARQHLGKACGICGKSLKFSLVMCSTMCCLVIKLFAGLHSGGYKPLVWDFTYSLFFSTLLNIRAVMSCCQLQRQLRHL